MTSIQTELETTRNGPAMPTLPADSKVGSFEVFYDGECPLCRREIDMVRRKDKSGQLILTDIAAPDFSAEGRSLDSLMREIHGRTSDGNYVTGVEVFRQIYERLGYQAWIAPTRLPVVRQTLDMAYRFFAYLRFRLAIRRMKRNQCSLLSGGASKCSTLVQSGNKEN